MKGIQHTVRRTVILVTLAAGLMLTACAPRLSYPGGGGGPGAPAITPARPGTPQFPQTGALIGASSSLPDGAQTSQQRIALMNQRDADAGRPYDIQHNFYAWDKTFPGWAEQEAIAHNRIPMISWNGTDTDVITSGQADGIIRTRARAVRDLQVPVFFRFFWEMDGHKGESLADGDPAKFIAAWRHLHAIFQQEGATNAAWVWAPTNYRFGGTFFGGVIGTSGPSWYPGDDVVDWIGVDGYNFAPNLPKAEWQSFEDVMVTWYTWAAQHDKPLMVAETGVVERNPGEKAAWINDMLTTLKTKYPRIKALVYFDLAFKFSGVTRMEWQVDSSADSYGAWNQIARDPYLNTRGL